MGQIFTIKTMVLLVYLKEFSINLSIVEVLFIVIQFSIKFKYSYFVNVLLLLDMYSFLKFCCILDFTLQSLIFKSLSAATATDDDTIGTFLSKIHTHTQA